MYATPGTGPGTGNWYFPVAGSGQGYSTVRRSPYGSPGAGALRDSWGKASPIERSPTGRYAVGRSPSSRSPARKPVGALPTSRRPRSAPQRGPGPDVEAMQAIPDPLSADPYGPFSQCA